MKRKTPGDPGDPGSGSQASKLAPARNWCFTWHKYPEEWHQCLVDQPKLSGFCVGQEVCPTTGTKHLQGWVQFKMKGRPFSLTLPRDLHWEKCKGSEEANFTYCTKEGDFSVWGSCAKMVPYCKLLPNPREWQSDVLEILKNPPDCRQIYWFWERTGGVGKTHLIKHVVTCLPELQVCQLNGSSADMRHGVVEFQKVTGTLPKAVLMNLPKGFDGKMLSYTGIEQVKDMCFFSGKYEGGQVCGPEPHVLIFANEPPQFDKLSEDRWQIFKIVDNKLNSDWTSEA